MIALLTPSRGLMFTKTVSYTASLLSRSDVSRWYISDGVPIPECFNDIVQDAMRGNENEFFYFIEEDMVPPPHAFSSLLSAMDQYDVCAIDYGMAGGFNTIGRSSKTKKILFTGFGCTMVKRRVFEALGYPYFRADKAYNISTLSWYDVDPHKAYGMYDIEFGSRIRKMGFSIGQVEGEAGHFKLTALGTPEINHGVHNIESKGGIQKVLGLEVDDL